MAERIPGKTTRRAIFEGIAGAGALGVLAHQIGGDAALNFIGAAQAQSLGLSAAANSGGLVHMTAAQAQTLPMAEWKDTRAATGSNRIAGTKASLEKAPAEASHYEAKLYTFPTGAIRVLTFKKGGPVLHQITFESGIYVLQGSLTLTPLPGHPLKPTKVSAGDALFLPTGVLSNPKPTSDTILVQMFVGSSSKKPKGGIMPAKSGVDTHSANWQEGSQEFQANKPDDLKKAPKNATHWVTRRYQFDGNSIRVATLKKGGRTNNVKNNRVDVLMYVTKGHLRRKEGEQIFDCMPGDVVREKKGDTGYWEVVEDSSWVAVDAPFDPKNFSPSEVG